MIYRSFSALFLEFLLLTSAAQAMGKQEDIPAAAAARATRLVASPAPERAQTPPPRSARPAAVAPAPRPAAAPAPARAQMPLPVPAIPAAAARAPQEPVGDGNSVDRELYLKAERCFRDWERGAREHDLMRFIRAVGKSALEEAQKLEIVGPLALLLADPENITFGAVERGVPAKYRKPAIEEWDLCVGYFGVTAAMCAEFYSLNLSERIERIRSRYPDFDK
jgi:hypothetical protein